MGGDYTVFELPIVFHNIKQTKKRYVVGITVQRVAYKRVALASPGSL